MIRKIIEIDQEKCDGCAICVSACHEGAIGMVEGKAKLIRDDYCDGLGDCLPACPTGAITFEEREAVAYQATFDSPKSQLTQWPVQIKLAPVNAPSFHNANLLIAADCTAFAYGDFHNQFIKNRITLIGCPKLDQGDYSEKLTAILAENEIKSVTVVRMEVPCCGGLHHAVLKALHNSGKIIPWQVVTISASGDIID
jgi:NAD-dependent dihydropyrimidine dehydrogenase PreA subunit